MNLARVGSAFPPLVAAAVLLTLCGTSFRGVAAGQPPAFASPEQAIEALSQATAATNRAALAELFGPESDALVNPDTVQSERELNDFSVAFNASHRLVRETPDRVVLEVGPDNWPLPIPLVKRTGGWQFDTEQGLQELLNRRIGRNELDVLRVLRAYVQAQREYASRDRDGDQVLEYAQRIRSSPGQTDGLFWPLDLNGEMSPFGPLVAYAQWEGYTGKAAAGETGPQPFHGYLFKILTRQGKHAPGGKYDYIINGNMIGGFGLVAWPAEYGDSGVMTFIVNQQGRVYQTDLGESTAKLAGRMKEYDLSEEWHVSPD